MSVISVNCTLSTKVCASCFATFAIPSRHEQKCSDEGAHWWCPCCGHQWQYGDNHLTRAQKDLEQERRRHETTQRLLERRNEQLETSEHRRRAEKAAKTRIKNRVANGVCPCCKRTFVNLSRHMKNKHPEFAESP